MKKIILLTALFLSPLAWSDSQLPDLPTFPIAPANPIDNQTKDEPTCEQVIPRLEAYAADANNHNQSVLGFLDQVAQTASNWQELLFPLENQTVTIPDGKFSPLKDNSSAIEQITSYAYDNSSYFAGELDQIITALKNCKR